MEGFFYSSVEDVQSKYWKSFVNKGFLFNENYFTTMLIHRGKIIFEDGHKLRLTKTMQFMEVPHSKAEKVLEEIFSLCHSSLLNTMGSNDNLYVRINLYRSLDNSLEYFIWSEKKDPLHSELVLRTHEFFPNKNYPSFIKKADYDIQFKLREKVKKLGADDVLFIDENNRVIDLATSNIVFMKGDHFFYSPIIPGVFDGICLNQFIGLIRALNYKVTCEEIQLKDISSFDGAIALNSFSIARPIFKVNDSEYNLDISEEIIEKFNKNIGLEWIERI